MAQGYTFSATVFMPTGSGIATIQFERFGQPVSDIDATNIFVRRKSD